MVICWIELIASSRERVGGCLVIVEDLGVPIVSARPVPLRVSPYIPQQFVIIVGGGL